MNRKSWKRDGPAPFPDVGWAVGSAVGLAVGSVVGWGFEPAVGSAVGLAVGSKVGSAVGLAIGLAVGAAAGSVASSSVSFLFRCYFGRGCTSFHFCIWFEQLQVSFWPVLLFSIRPYSTP